MPTPRARARPSEKASFVASGAGKRVVAGEAFVEDSPESEATLAGVTLRSLGAAVHACAEKARYAGAYAQERIRIVVALEIEITRQAGDDPKQFYCLNSRKASRPHLRPLLNFDSCYQRHPAFAVRTEYYCFSFRQAQCLLRKSTGKIR